MAILSFSSRVYPESRSTSMRSRSAGGMGSEKLAVQMNITRDRS